MSQTQVQRPVSLFGGTPNSNVVGVIVTPDCLTSREVDIAHELVRDRRLKPIGLEPLINLFFELGLSSRGFLGCVQVPIGELTNSWHGPTVRARKSVPVWAVLSGKEYSSPRGTATRGVTYMNTNQFVSWLQKTGVARESHTFSLDPIPEASGALQDFPGQLRRAFTLPETPNLARTAAPLPSSAEEQAPPPPSYVSQLGDIRRENQDELTRLESEFRSTPRVDGGRQFDQDEYFRRLDALNEQRQQRGLPIRTAPTPSTYTR